MDDISIRQELDADHERVEKLVKSAFEHVDESDHQEHLLVAKLRRSSAFIPELSLVAELKDQLVGHILLTTITIDDGDAVHNSLALAPVSVLPEYQNLGIGSQLIEVAHQKARALGYQSIIVLGHENYYPRFGYVQAHHFNVALPFDVPKENCFAIELTTNALEKVSGIVKYPKEFY